MVLGYARVSTEGQNLNRQLDSLEQYGIDIRNIYQEKFTGTKKDRPQFNNLIQDLRKGDVLVITELTRLGRSTKDLIQISETLQELEVELISLKENIDTTTAAGKAMFGMLSVMAQFERDLISERTKEGLKSARLRGIKGGRPKVPKETIQKALKLYDSQDFSIAQICSMCNISKNTLYNYIRQRKMSQKTKND